MLAGYAFSIMLVILITITVTGAPMGLAMIASSVFYLVPPTTALMAWLLFNEPITTATLLGTALTALGVSLVVRGAAVRKSA